MMRDFRLYAITDERSHPGRELVEVMEETILGGADIIQLRDKTSSREEVLKKAKLLRELTRRYDVPFIVNDYIDIAVEVDADGVHLGQEDVPLVTARQLIGHNKIIGISTHKIDEALRAEQDGADYIGAGPVYPTTTKVATPVTLSYIREVASRIRIPFVAIGGIKLHNVDEVIAAGATRICAVSEIVGSSDVRGTCEEFIRRLERAKSR